MLQNPNVHTLTILLAILVATKVYSAQLQPIQIQMVDV